MYTTKLYYTKQLQLWFYTAFLPLLLWLLALPRFSSLFPPPPFSVAPPLPWSASAVPISSPPASTPNIRVIRYTITNTALVAALHEDNRSPWNRRIITQNNDVVLKSNQSISYHFRSLLLLWFFFFSFLFLVFLLLLFTSFFLLAIICALYVQVLYHYSKYT